MRTLKFHEQKLLKKVNFLEWKSTNTTREQVVSSRFCLKTRDEYLRYNKVVAMIRKLTESLSRLADSDATKRFIGRKLIALLYDTGIIPERRLADCATVGVTALCQRRLPSVMVRRRLVEHLADADKFVRQGHVRVGAREVSDPAMLVSREMEEYVAWIDGSKIRRKIDEFQDAVDDARYA